MDNAQALRMLPFASQAFSKCLRSLMSSTISVVALAVASLTWWNQAPQPVFVEQPPAPPQSEFSCSARCPAPSASATVATAPASSLWLGAAGFVLGFFVCLALLSWRSWRPEVAPLIAARPAERPVGFAPTEPEPPLAIEGPVTPAVRRRLRELKNAAQA